MGQLLSHLDALWLGALLALPVTLGVMIACRFGVRSPATRHALWLVALLAFVAPAVVATTAWPAALRRWSAPIVDLLPERPIPTGVPAASAFFDSVPVTPERSPSDAAHPLASDLPAITRPTFERDVSAHPVAEPQAQSAALRSEPDSYGMSPDQPRADAHPEPAAARGDLPTPPTPTQRIASQLNPWIDGLRSAFEGLRDVPPLPPLIWLGGVTAFVTLLLLRLLRDRRLTRLALPANESELAALRQAATTIGLRSAPELVFVPTRVSPMVTCGARKRLVMPRSLWRVLDADARQAVLLHELAHLRRRDHWVHWIALAVGALYWWHPLVWVIRARLRDEADLCCDAWVTALRPERRRGYAETLLQTTAFLNVPGVRTHAAGLAMASPTKRKLARRITMVMTHTVRPKLSVHGSSIVAGVAMLALLVMPGVACPPDEKGAPEAPRFPAPDGQDSTFERHMRGQTGERLAPELPERPERARTDRRRQLDAEAETVRGRLAGIGRHMPEAPPAPPTAWRSNSVGSAPGFPQLATADAQVARAYHLPAGRLHALTTLMTRADVPVLVSPEESRLIVHATRDQHQTFASFARMICPEGVKITDENGEPISEEMFWREGAVARAPRPDRVNAPEWEVAARVATERSTAQAKLHTKRAELAHVRRALASEERAIAQRAAAFEAEADRIEREASAMVREADRAFNRAESRRDKAEHYKNKGDYAKAAAYAAEADSLIKHAEALLAQADDLERRSEDMEAQAEELESKADALEARAEDLEAQMESIGDEAAELDDHHDHAQDEDHDHDR